MEDTTLDVPSSFATMKKMKKSVRFSVDTKFRTYDGEKQKSDWLLEDAFADLEELQNTFRKIEPTLNNNNRRTVVVRDPVKNGTTNDEGVSVGAVRANEIAMQPGREEALLATTAGRSRQTHEEGSSKASASSVVRPSGTTLAAASGVQLPLHRSELLRRFFPPAFLRVAGRGNGINGNGGNRIFHHTAEQQAKMNMIFFEQLLFSIRVEHKTQKDFGIVYSLVNKNSADQSGNKNSNSRIQSSVFPLLQKHGLNFVVFKKCSFGPGNLLTAAMLSGGSCTTKMMNNSPSCHFLPAGGQSYNFYPSASSSIHTDAILNFLLDSPTFFLNRYELSLTEKIRAYGLLLVSAAYSGVSVSALVCLLDKLLAICAEQGLVSLGRRRTAVALQVVVAEGLRQDRGVLLEDQGVVVASSSDQQLQLSRNTHILPRQGTLELPRDNHTAKAQSGSHTSRPPDVGVEEGPQQQEEPLHLNAEKARSPLATAVQKVLFATYHTARIRGNTHICRQLLQQFARIPMLAKDVYRRPHLLHVKRPERSRASAAGASSSSWKFGFDFEGEGSYADQHLDVGSQGGAMGGTSTAAGINRTKSSSILGGNPSTTTLRSHGITSGDRLTRLMVLRNKDENLTAGNNRRTAAYSEAKSFFPKTGTDPTSNPKNTTVDTGHVKSFTEAADMLVLQKCPNLTLEFDTRPVESSGFVDAVVGNDVEWVVGLLWNCFAVDMMTTTPSCASEESTTSRVVDNPSQLSLFQSLYLPSWSSLETDLQSETRKIRVKQEISTTELNIWMIALRHYDLNQFSNETIFSEFWDGYDTEIGLREMVMSQHFQWMNGSRTAPELLHQTRSPSTRASWNQFQHNSFMKSSLEYAISWKETTSTSRGLSGATATADHDTSNGSTSSSGNNFHDLSSDIKKTADDSDLDWLSEGESSTDEEESSATSSSASGSEAEAEHPEDQKVAEPKQHEDNGGSLATAVELSDRSASAATSQQPKQQSKSESKNTKLFERRTPRRISSSSETSGTPPLICKPVANRGTPTIKTQEENHQNSVTQAAENKAKIKIDPVPHAVKTLLHTDIYPQLATQDRQNKRKQLLTILLEQLLFGPVCCLLMKNKHEEREKEEQEKQVELEIEKRCKEKVAALTKKQWHEPPPFVDCGRCGWGMPSEELLVALKVERPKEEVEEVVEVPFWERKQRIWKFKRPGNVPFLRIPDPPLEPYTLIIAPKILSDSESSTTSDEDSSTSDDASKKSKFLDPAKVTKTADRWNAEMQKLKEKRRRKLQKYRNDTRFQLVEVHANTAEILSADLQKWIGVEKIVVQDPNAGLFLEEGDEASILHNSKKNSTSKAGGGTTDQQQNTILLKPMSVDDCVFSDSDEEFQKDALAKLLQSGARRAEGMVLPRNLNANQKRRFEFDHAVGGASATTDFAVDKKVNPDGPRNDRKTATTSGTAPSTTTTAGEDQEKSQKKSVGAGGAAIPDVVLEKQAKIAVSANTKSVLSEELQAKLGLVDGPAVVQAAGLALLPVEEDEKSTNADGEMKKSSSKAADDLAAVAEEQGSKQAVKNLLPAAKLKSKLDRRKTAAFGDAQEQKSTGDVLAQKNTINGRNSQKSVNNYTVGQNKSRTTTSSTCSSSSPHQNPDCHALWIETLAQVDLQSGKNVLMLAIEKNVHANVVELLLKACALNPQVLHDVLRHRDHLHETCIQKANRLGRKDVLMLLKRHFKV
ncbi:unnamed protein product [Amoebophrya sp. A120]|nr:unnamed protein product [Amoebophrya sp. A120]|eukprot:GSA120T00022578001.1